MCGYFRAFCGRDFRAGQETIATEGEKHSFPSRVVTFEREEQYRGVPTRIRCYTPFIFPLRGAKGRGTGFPKKGKRVAGCRLPVRLAARTYARTHVCTHACTYARLRECDKLCEEAGLATERRGPTIKEPVTFQILARRAHVKSATLRARGIFLPSSLLPDTRR